MNNLYKDSIKSTDKTIYYYQDKQNKITNFREVYRHPTPGFLVGIPEDSDELLVFHNHGLKCKDKV